MKNMIRFLMTVILALCFLSSCSDPEEDALFGDGEGIRFMAKADKDTYMDSNLVSNNFGSCESLKLGTGLYSKYRVIMHFDLRDIPVGVSIEYASLTFSCTKVSGTAQIAAYPITKLWEEGEENCSGSFSLSGTWYYAESIGAGGRAWTNLGGDFDPISASNTVNITGTGTYTFIMNNAVVKYWVDNYNSNFGIIIICSDEATMENFVTLGSRESSAGAVLRIRYK